MKLSDADSHPLRVLRHDDTGVKKNRRVVFGGMGDAVTVRFGKPHFPVLFRWEGVCHVTMLLRGKRTAVLSLVGWVTCTRFHLGRT